MVGLLRTRWARMAAGTIAMLTIGIGTATTAQAQEGNEDARVSVDISAQRFVVEGDRIVARGPVAAKVVQSDGTTTTLNKRITLRVKAANRCRILDLSLAELYLNLLGLEVRTSDINVEITGDSKRALGRLFCDLSKGLKLNKRKLAKRTAISLNRKLDGRPLRIVSFEAPVRAQQQPSDGGTRSRRAEVPPVPPGSCEVLNLLLGPLQLDLLGLIVELYGPTREEAVQVLVTANPNGGSVGAALCEVGGEPTRR